MKRIALVTIGTLALAGCTGTSSEERAQATQEGPQIVVRGADLREPTQEEVDAHWDEMGTLFERMDQEWPQDIEIVRWISRDEWDSTMAECLIDAGFPMEIGRDGYLRSSEIEGDREIDEYLASWNICEAQYPVHPASEWEIGDAYFSAQYDYLIHEWTPCMEWEGYPQPVPLTREEFIERIRSTGDAYGSFGAFDAIRHLSEDEFYAVLWQCPLKFYPPAELRNG